MDKKQLQKAVSDILCDINMADEGTNTALILVTKALVDSNLINKDILLNIFDEAIASFNKKGVHDRFKSATCSLAHAIDPDRFPAFPKKSIDWNEYVKNLPPFQD